MLCSRCKKRQAVVFVTNNNSKDAPTTGYCLTCAKELGIKPVEDLIKKMPYAEYGRGRRYVRAYGAARRSGEPR